MSAMTIETRGIPLEDGTETACASILAGATKKLRRGDDTRICVDANGVEGGHALSIRDRG